MTDTGPVSAMAKRGKEDVPARIAGLTEDDAAYGRDSKRNPVNAGTISAGCFWEDHPASRNAACTCGCHRRDRI